jgi:tetratricopeptide (TPR) repeat protein
MLVRVTCVILLWGSLIITSRICAAQPADRKADAAAREHYKRGMRFYDLGRFDDAIHEFETAYESKEDPFYIYNLAQAHRRAGNLSKAIELYRTYLRKSPNAPDRSDVEQRIAAIEKSLASTPAEHGPKAEPRGATSAVTPPAAQVTAAEPAPSEPPRLPTVQVGGPAEPREQPSKTSPMFVTGLVTGGTGIVLAGVGVALAVSASSRLSDVRNAATYDPSAEDSAKSKRTVGYVLIGAGAAAAVAGTTLLVLGMNSDQPPRGAFLGPMIGPQHAGLVLAGSF